MKSKSIKWVAAAILALPLIFQVAISATFAMQFFDVLSEVERKSSSRDFVVQCYALESKVIESFCNLTLSIDSHGLIDPVATRNECFEIERLIAKLLDRCRQDHNSSALSERAQRLNEVFNQSKEFIFWCLSEQARGSQNWKTANNEAPEKVIGLCNKFMQSFNAIISTQGEGATEEVLSQWHAIKQFLNLCLAATAVMALGLIFLFAFFIKTPLSKIAARCNEIAFNQPLSPPLKSNNELGELDRLIYAMGVNLDAMLQAEKSMVSNARDMICSIDSHGKIKKANDYSEVLLGYSKDEIIGKSFLDLCCQADASIADDQFKNAFGAAESKVFELRLQKKGGAQVDTRWSSVWSEGELFAVVHDISEEKNLDRLKQDFLNMVSHDLRSPLTSLMGTFSMLAQGTRGPLPTDAKREILGAERNIERLIEFINDFLDLQKIESGNMQLALASINLVEVAEEAIVLLKGVSESKRIQVVLSKKDVFVNGDKHKLSRVFQNLLSNAISFSPVQGTISVEFELMQNDIVEVRVIDEGPGVPIAYREAIFQPFAQAPTHSSSKGTGLGLAICKLIVEAHRGEIGVGGNFIDEFTESFAVEGAAREKHGAIFWIHLPAQ